MLCNGFRQRVQHLSLNRDIEIHFSMGYKIWCLEEIQDPRSQDDSKPIETPRHWSNRYWYLMILLYKQKTLQQEF